MAIRIKRSELSKDFQNDLNRYEIAVRHGEARPSIQKLIDYLLDNGRAIIDSYETGIIYYVQSNRLVSKFVGK